MNELDQPESEEEEAWNLAQIRQRPSRLNAKPIKSVVKRLMAQTGYGQIEATSQLQTAWKDAAGEMLAGMSQPGKITRGVLAIIAADSSVSHELTFRKKQILKTLNEQLPRSEIKDMRVRVGRIS